VEIVMRLLSAESRVPLHVLRSGQLSDDDWTKLARRMGEISEAPLFVDDTPNMNLMEIRAKARRLKQRHDLKLVVVDYLQLMTSPKRVESRQQEVAELSRGLKLLAKEVDCPVIAVSQLNRGPEQRNDKRPQLSDLRESGCLTAATRVMRADTNAEVTLGELLSAGERDVPVWALNERLQYSPRTMTHVFPSGRRPVFALRLASGKRIEATANHPFLTFDGWTPLAGLRAGARIGTPRHVPPPLAPEPCAEPELVAMAHLLGGGSSVGGGSWVGGEPIGRAGRAREDLAAEAAASVGLPAWIFGLPKAQVAVFLGHLWASGGSVTTRDDERGGEVRLAAASRRLLEDVSRLLLRFGITARLVERPAGQGRAGYTVEICDRDDQLRFLREIGVPGHRVTARRRLLRALETGTSNAEVDTIPGEVWERVRQVLLDPGPPRPWPAAAAGVPAAGGAPGEPETAGQRLGRVAAVLDDAGLEMLATNDIYWDEVVAIEPLGVQDVYDATVLGTHNFIANGIAVHNSIEQDADVVILLHRDDYYDKESPRAGEADFIVAKHRNGPTDTVTVAAQLHLSRFVDMAIV
jgi:replicative DNA helicase